MWGTNIWDMTTYINPAATDIRIRLRVSDWSYISAPVVPATFDPGPGPYNDQIRIGRRVLIGPSLSPGIDERFEAQDCVPTQLASFGVPGVVPSSPTRIRLRLCIRTCSGPAPSRWAPTCTINGRGSNLVTGDSICMTVVDGRGVGGVTSVKFYGAIVAGPHQGKGMGYTVGANGFFEVQADSCQGLGRLVRSPTAGSCR